MSQGRDRREVVLRGFRNRSEAMDIMLNEKPLFCTYPFFVHVFLLRTTYSSCMLSL